MRVQTQRLRLRVPQPSDAAAIFEAYASQPEVVKYVGWPRHTTLADTRAFLDFAASEWSRWPVGPLVIEELASGRLVGSTGLAFESPDGASTGYVLAADSWGKGYASEALAAVVRLAGSAGVRRLHALCHADHAASRRVLERCSFVLEEIRPKQMVFPNLADGQPQDVCCYVFRESGIRSGTDAPP